MNLMDFKYLTDENISNDFYEYLIGIGLDVKDVKKAKLAGKSDLFLMNIAYEENRIIISHDSDFGRLAIIESILFVGIIFLKPGHLNPSFSISSWEAIAESGIDLHPPFMLTAENREEIVKIRYRQV